MAKKTLTLDYTSEQIPVLFKRLGDGAGELFRIYEDEANECYRFFHTDEDAQTWITEYNAAKSEGRAMDTAIAALEFAGNYIPGSPNYTATIAAIHGDGEKAIEGSTGNYVQFRANITDRSKNDTGESLDVYITITNSVMSRTIYNIYRSNELVTVNIDDYVSLGDNDVVILVKGRASGASKTIVMTYNIFQLVLTSSFNISQAKDPNTNFVVNYNIKGSGQKIVYFYLDGVETYNHTVSANDTDVSLSQTIINFDGRLAPGKHTLQMYAVSNSYPSELLYYEFVIGGIEETFTTCLVSYTFPSGTTPFTGDTPGFTGTQYVTKTLDWAYYTNDSTVVSPKVTWRLYKNGVETHLATRNADVVEAETDKMPDPIEFMPDDYGSYRLQALIEGYDYIMPNAHTTASGSDHDDPQGLIACYSIEVAQNTEVQEHTQGLILKYSGLGRSNDEPEATRTSLTDNGIAATFYNMPWNGRYGYLDNAIVFGGGAYMTIPVNPLDTAHDVRSNGNTTEVDFEVTDIKSEDRPLFLIGGTADYHIAIYPTKAELKTDLGTKVEVRFRENERHKIAFVTYPDDATIAGTNQRMMMLYIDGIRTAVVQYGTTDVMYNSATQVVVGDSTAMATFKLYYLRLFQGVVPYYRLLDHYIIDSGSNIATLVKRNDIYTSGSHTEISVDKLKAILPVWEMTGPFDKLFVAVQDKTAFSASGKYTDTSNPEDYMEGADFEVKPSGESSLSDNMVKGFHLKFNKGNNQIYDADGKAINGNRWTPFAGCVPEKKIRLNADGLESSHTHNGALQNVINTVFRKAQVNGTYVLRTPIQEYVDEHYAQDMVAKYGGSVDDYEFPYKIGYASTWKPVAVVWRPDTSSAYDLLGIFSMGEEKKSDFAHGRRSVYLKKTDDGTLDPFDFYTGVKGDRGYNNEGTVQFEVVRDSDLTFMNSADKWDTDRAVDMEKEYQDEDDLTTEENNAEWNLLGDEVIKPMCALYQGTNVVDNIPIAYGDQDGFHNLLFGGTFNVWSFLAARIIIRRCGLTDTYVRNSQWLRLPATYSSGTPTSYKWWFAYWDLDMAFGLQQPSGSLVIDPCLDREAIVDSNFVFTGKQYSTGKASWFWDGFDKEIELGKARLVAASTDAEIAAARVNNLYYMMVQLEDALANAGFTATAITSEVESWADTFGEALYNADGQTKYLDSFARGSNYLLRLQGNRLAHFKWWINESFERWDAEFATGKYQGNAVAFRLVNNPADAKVKITAAAHSFFGIGCTSTTLQTGVELSTGDTYEFTIGRALNANDPLQIYVPNKIAELDLSDAAQVISGNVELSAFYNSDSATMTIRKIDIGVPVEKMEAGTFNNASNKTWTMPTVGLNTLEELNINGYRYVSDSGTLDLSKMSNLTTLNAIGATGLTSLTPAAGSTIGDYNLPDSLMSLVLSSNTIGSIKFWSDTANGDGTYTIAECGIPSSLRTLQMTSMGNDTNAHQLFADWLTMVGQQEDTTPYRVQYTNINVPSLSIDNVMLLCQMKLALSSSVNISGYIKCTSEYTVEQMNTIISAFGEDVFSLNKGKICFDCNSNKITVSASGTNTTVDSDGKINVLQGTSAQFQAVGFPLRATSSTYKWYVVLNDEYITGTETLPNIAFGHNTLGYMSGLLSTTECSDASAEYTIYVERSSGGTGTATLKVNKRTYPTSSTINLLSAQASYDKVGDEYSIYNLGHYLFNAIFTPEEYNGHMKETDGGVWTATGIDTTYCNSCDDAADDPFTKFCLQVTSLPEEDLEITLAYLSNWKNDLQLKASNSPIRIVIQAIINNVLTTSAVSGNPALFADMEALGVAHSDPDSYNSKELKALVGECAISDTALKNFTSNGKNVLKFLRNVTKLTLDGCTGLTGDLDLTSMHGLQEASMIGAHANAIIDSNNESLTKIAYGSPTKISISGCTNLDITEATE